MEELFEKNYHDLESSHFWFKARRKFIIDLLKKEDRDVKILDIGCSSGHLLEDLIKAGFNADKIFGIDISEKAINVCRRKGLRNVFVMDAQDIKFDFNFDVIIASDCLEHLEFDQMALSSWNGLLNKGGRAHIFVPAFMSIWSNHDVLNRHFRRYKLKEMQKKMLKSGFEIFRSSYWNFGLFWPVFIIRYVESTRFRKTKQSTGDLTKASILNSVFFRVLIMENYFLKRFNFPIGLSVYCGALKSID